jgi:CMP-N-acetylneuraminic acid synthetase
MYNGKTFLAIIPARGGSKRLPNKNILELKGKPLICWTIESALGCEYIDEIVVSSDSDRILEISRKYGIRTIKRPPELATDTSPTIDAVKHVIQNLEKKYDYVVLLQPTSPLRKSIHIREAIELLFQKNADAIISVCEAEHHPLWCNTLPQDLSMKNFLRKDIINKRSQDLPKYYRLNGAIYICKTDRLVSEGTFFVKDNIFAYIMDRKSSVDIDDEIDFKLAEILISSEQ